MLPGALKSGRIDNPIIEHEDVPIRDEFAAVVSAVGDVRGRSPAAQMEA